MRKSLYVFSLIALMCSTLWVMPLDAQERSGWITGSVADSGGGILPGARGIAAAGKVFAVGDLAYPDGSDEQFADCYGPTWGRFKDRTRPAPGNHEYHSDGASGYNHYFGTAAGDPKKGYYSYDLGAWHVIAL